MKFKKLQYQAWFCFVWGVFVCLFFCYGQLASNWFSLFLYSFQDILFLLPLDKRCWTTDTCSKPVRLFLHHSFFLYGIGRQRESGLQPKPHKLLMLDFFLYRLFGFDIKFFLIVRSSYLKITNQQTVNLEIIVCLFCSFPQPQNLFHNHGICWLSKQLKMKY